MQHACKQAHREGEADRADSSSVSGLMTIISHLPFRLINSFPLLKTAVIHCGLRSAVVSAKCFMHVVCVGHRSRAKHLSIHLTLPNELLGWDSFIVWCLCLALDTAGSVLGKGPAQTTLHMISGDTSGWGVLQLNISRFYTCWFQGKLSLMAAWNQT